MVEVDPFVLVGAGVAAMGIVGLTIFNSWGGKSKSSDQKPTASSEAPAPSKAASSKPKKKSKSSKSKANKPTAVDASSASELSGEDVAVIAPVKSKAAAVRVPEEEPVAPAAPVAVAVAAPAPAPVEATTKKSKKAKETASQKAERVRLQREELAKAQEVADAMEASDAGAASAADDAAADEELATLQEFYNKMKADTPASAAAAAPASFDGWAVVGGEKGKVDKKKKPKSDAEDEAEEKEEVATFHVVVEEVAKEPAPVQDYVTEEVEVETKKMGLLIGPKGVTKIGIQNITGAEINMPKVDKEAEKATATISVSGTSAAVKAALKAIKELCTKGYANILTPENFVEGQVTVHSRHIADIIGKGGSTVKIIMNATGVKITTPGNISKLNGRGEPSSKVKIGLAGVREQVSIARNTILELCKYGHTDMTHPNLTHKELAVPDNYYNYIIGSKGSEIKHIQANYKVSITIPGDDSSMPNVLIVGEPANVDSAEKHILRLIEKVDTQAAERVAAAARDEGKAYNASSGAGKEQGQVRERAPRPPRQEPEDPEEPWMKEFTQRRAQMSLSSLLPTNFAPVVSAAAPAPVDAPAAAAAPVPAPVAAPAPAAPAPTPTNGEATEEEVDAAGPSISKSTAPHVPSGSWGQPLPQSFLP